MYVIHALSRLAGISLAVQIGAAHTMTAPGLTLAKRQSLSLQRDHANAATVDTRSVYETAARSATRPGASPPNPSASTVGISCEGLHGLRSSNLGHPKMTIRKEADMKYITCPMISSSDRSSGTVTALSSGSSLQIL